ncbi:hypothetical protein DK846_16925 [Methanospirillum lacunae]|uniref:Uncharacterized protein n=2 Tax=Methanospirillum lacunae TaxID=668570 RepID=A0A2V2N3A3_9EURY|nr:hypothetical protein DK846_16925 [Methanospirillum lacunae]
MKREPRTTLLYLGGPGRSAGINYLYNLKSLCTFLSFWVLLLDCSSIPGRWISGSGIHAPSVGSIHLSFRSGGGHDGRN